MSHHACVWLDHTEAKIFQFSGDSTVEEVVAATPDHHIRHGNKQGGRRGTTEEDHAFYHAIAQALAEAKQVLILGPSTAKLELIRHVHKHDHALEPRIVGVETVDHPTDGQLVAYAKKYFSEPIHR